LGVRIRGETAELLRHLRRGLDSEGDLLVHGHRDVLLAAGDGVEERVAVVADDGDDGDDGGDDEPALGAAAGAAAEDG
jgi:hypothetical protein